MREVVVLLVGPASLPGRLEEVLSEKGMFVESCEVEQASGTILVTNPDVVITGHEAVSEVARSVRASSDSGNLKLLVMAPRGQVSNVRRSLPDEVTAVLPLDLPPAAIFVRVKTLTSKALGPAPSHALGNAEASPSDDGARQKSAAVEEVRSLPGRSGPSASPLLAPEEQCALPPLPNTREEQVAARRISLQVPATALLPLRIALLDEDVTRADALSSVLRKSGHDVFLVSGRSRGARWHLLRKFSPQAIIVDEAGLSHDGGAWIGAFRSDRFLQAVPLIAVALESLFDSDEGVADISALTPQLDGLGRVEARFLSELSPGREIEVSPSQIGLARLLTLVAAAGTPATLEIKSRAETLSWNIVSGSLDPARLSSGARSLELSPAAALTWALGCPASVILVRPQQRMKLRAGVLVEELLRDAYRADLPPEEAFWAPGGRARQQPQVGSFASLPTDDSGPRELATDYSAEGEEAPESEMPTRPVTLSEIPGLSDMIKAAPPFSVDRAPKPDSTPPSSVGRNTPPGVVRAIALPAMLRPTSIKNARWLGAAALVIFVGGATWSLSRGASSGAGSLDGSPSAVQAGLKVRSGREGSENLPRIEATDAKPPSPVVEPQNAHPMQTEKSGDSPSVDDLWRVRNIVKMDDCDVLLDRPLDYYTSQPEWEGEKIWKRARQQLLVGEYQAANRLMCQAAFIDPDGRASVGLGEFYLAHRSLETAKEWAQYGIEQRPEDARKSRELLGDVLSQMGQAKEAKEQWLQTMKLAPDDLPKLRSLAKTLARLGRTARGGGDSALAERLFRRAAALDEDNVEASGGLASALLKNGEAELALKWARRTLSLDANSGEALLVMGDLARDKRDVAGARRHYEEIKQGTPAYKTAQSRLEEL